MYLKKFLFGIVIGIITLGVGIFAIVIDTMQIKEDIIAEKLYLNSSGGQSDANVFFDGVQGDIHMQRFSLLTGMSGEGQHSFSFNTGAFLNRSIFGEDIVDGSLSTGKFSFNPYVDGTGCTLSGVTIPHRHSLLTYMVPMSSHHCKPIVRTCIDGYLSGSGDFLSCDIVPVEPKSCVRTPWGTLKHGDAVIAYESAEVYPSQTCQPQSRVCVDGVLLGSFSAKTCVVKPGRSCELPRGGIIAHDQSVVTYSQSSVDFDDVCVPNIRSCNDGQLLGNGDFLSCQVEPPLSCTLPWGGTIPDGQASIAYPQSTPLPGQSCQAEARYCDNGVLQGSALFQSCTVPLYSGCSLPWGGIISHGEAVVAYGSDTVSYGSTCFPNMRTCNNGVLGGFGTYPYCSSVGGGPQTCGTPFGILSQGQAVITYDSPTVPFGTTCTPQLRVCNQGNFPQGGAYTTCSVSGAGSPCLGTPFGDLNHAQPVVAYVSPSVPFGSQCVPVARTCYNGVLLGSGDYSTCSVGSGNQCTTTNFGSIDHGDSVTGYLINLAIFPEMCTPISRTCYNGTLFGTGEFTGCVQLLSSGQSCTGADFGIVPGDWTGSARTETGLFGGTWTGVYTGIIPHGFSLFPYSVLSASTSNVCDLARHQRLCVDGNLLGTGRYSSCEVGGLDNLPLYYFGTGSPFTQYWSGNTCDRTQIEVEYIYPGSGVIYQSHLSLSHKMFVFLPGKHELGEFILEGAECVGLVGIGKVDFFPTFFSSDNYYSIIKIDAFDNVILHNITLHGEETFSGQNISFDSLGNSGTMLIVRITSGVDLTVDSVNISQYNQGVFSVSNVMHGIFHHIKSFVGIVSAGPDYAFNIFNSQYLQFKDIEIGNYFGGMNINNLKHSLFDQIRIYGSSEAGINIMDSEDLVFNNMLVFSSAKGIVFGTVFGSVMNIVIQHSQFFDNVQGVISNTPLTNIFFHNVHFYNNGKGMVLNGTNLFVNNILFYNNGIGYDLGLGCVNCKRYGGFVENFNVVPPFGGFSDGSITDSEVQYVSGFVGSYSSVFSDSLSGALGGSMNCNNSSQPYSSYFGTGGSCDYIALSFSLIPALGIDPSSIIYGNNILLQGSVMTMSGTDVVPGTGFVVDVTKPVGYQGPP